MRVQSVRKDVMGCDIIVRDVTPVEHNSIIPIAKKCQKN